MEECSDAHKDFVATGEFTGTILLDMYKDVSEALFDALFELREAYGENVSWKVPVVLNANYAITFFNCPT